MVGFFEEEGSIEMGGWIGEKKDPMVGGTGENNAWISPSLLFLFCFVFSCFRHCWLVGLGAGVGVEVLFLVSL